MLQTGHVALVRAGIQTVNNQQHAGLKTSLDFTWNAGLHSLALLTANLW
jgi:hypothetical protein